MKISKKMIVVAILCFSIIPLCSGIISSYYFSEVDKKVEIRQKIDVKDEVLGTNTLSIYLETEEGSEEYTLSDSDVFLADGYYFNEEKSKCENGGLLSFDKSTGKVRMSTNASDRCYVYFDKESPSLGNFADYIKGLYTTQGANGLYLHDSALANGAGDNSYRYAGPRDTVNNYVCFGSNDATCPNENLYRIIGVFDNKVKLIKYDYTTIELGTDGVCFSKIVRVYDYNPFESYLGLLDNTAMYYWADYSNGPMQHWSNSPLNTVNLNEKYINNLGDWANKIALITWNVGEISEANGMRTNAKRAYDYEVGANKINETYEAKVGLMYVSEYYYSALPSHWTKPGMNSDATKDYRSAVDDNWMYMGFAEWTISRIEDYIGRTFALDYKGAINNLGYEVDLGVRPTFFLNSDVVLSEGDGTKANPYRIKI